jgi:hypothetical protein
MYDDYALPLEQNLELMAREYARVKVNTSEEIKEIKESVNKNDDMEKNRIILTERLNNLRKTIFQDAVKEEITPKTEEKPIEKKEEKKEETEKSDRLIDVNAVINIIKFEKKVNHLIKCIINNLYNSNNSEVFKFLLNLNEQNINMLKNNYKVNDIEDIKNPDNLTFNICKSRLNQVLINLIIEYNLLLNDYDDNDIKKALMNTLSFTQILNLLK